MHGMRHAWAVLGPCKYPPAGGFGAEPRCYRCWPAPGRQTHRPPPPPCDGPSGRAPAAAGPMFRPKAGFLNYSRGIVWRRHIARHRTRSRWQLGGMLRYCKRLQKIFIPDGVGRKVSLGCACKWFCTQKGPARVCAPAACFQGTCRDSIARHIARSPSPAQALCGLRALCV